MHKMAPSSSPLLLRIREMLVIVYFSAFFMWMWRRNGGGSPLFFFFPSSSFSSSDSSISSPSSSLSPSSYPYSCEMFAKRGTGEYPQEDIIAAATQTVGWDGLGMWHQHETNTSCPKFLGTEVNSMAGIGHRFSNIMSALHAAVYFNITYAYFFDWGNGVHGGYSGWDTYLGLSRQEYSLQEAKARPGVEVVTLPCFNLMTGQTMNTVVYEHLWGKTIRDPTKCNVLYKLQTDCWPYDSSSLSKPALGIKWMLARTSTAQHSLLWSPSHVNIAVHVRKGDVYTTHESFLARIVREVVLPQLRNAGVEAQVSVHVFAERDGRETFTGLASLEQEESRRSGGGVPGSSYVNVTFYPGLDPWLTLYHFTQSDYLVMGDSGFSRIASYVATRPLCLAPPNSDTQRHCHAHSVCCDHDGTCSFEAHMRVRNVADRLRAHELCGLLETRSSAGV